MDKKICLFILACFFIVLSIIYVKAVEYPIVELGNCASEAECETFCNVVENMENCINYAEKTNMMSAEEINEARKFLPYLKAGETPGKCKSESECNNYCSNEANINECVDFAVKVGDVSAEEAAMIKKTGGKGPGGCNSKKSCDAFCEDEANLNECIDFAVQYGMMSAEEAEMVKKTGGKGPGNCKGKEECDNFCKDEANFATCVDFSVQYGMMSAEEAEMVKATGGKGPGGCNSKESCDAFCKESSNQQTCMEFGIELDLKLGKITPEEAERRRKEASAPRPGGCSSEQECRDYCSKNENFEECLSANRDAGRISEEQYQEDLRRFREGNQPPPEGQTGEAGTAPGGESGTYPGGEPGTAEGGESGTQPAEGGITTPSNEPGTETGGEPGTAPSSDSGGGDAGVTGGVIMETNSGSILVEIKDFLNNLF